MTQCRSRHTLPGEDRRTVVCERTAASNRPPFHDGPHRAEAAPPSTRWRVWDDSGSITVQADTEAAALHTGGALLFGAGRLQAVAEGAVAHVATWWD